MPRRWKAQARGVDGIELKRTRLDEAHFILAIENPKISNDADATRAIEAKDAALAAEQRAAAQQSRIDLNFLRSETQPIGGDL